MEFEGKGKNISNKNIRHGRGMRRKGFGRRMMKKMHSSKKKIIIGLAGNPNCGKTTIFNALTGSNYKVGNYPGVTVEKKEGVVISGDYILHFYDLPGTYSLSAYSLDEVVARDFIINEKPDVIINVIDSTNIERNLYLTMQFQELGVPIVGALNISDQAFDMGIRINEKMLSKLLDIPFIKTVGTKNEGIDKLIKESIEMYEKGARKERVLPNYGREVESKARKLLNVMEKDSDFSKRYNAHWLSVKLLEKDENALEKTQENKHFEKIKEIQKGSIEWIEKHFNEPSDIVVAEQRYAYIHGACKEAVQNFGGLKRFDLTEAVDSVLLNKFIGLPIFLFLMWVIFQITFTLGEYPMALIEMFIGKVSIAAKEIIPPGYVQSLIVDGILGGVGGMLVFVPNILLLFFGISILEDTGYMARAAFLVDKIMHKIGLHGQSLIPLIIGFGCSVPAILGTRVLRNPKDRITTALVVPFMSCGARLPVYVLLAGAFFGKQMAGNVIFSIYMIGIALAVLFGFIFRKTLFKGESTPFVMELPPYRIPTIRGIISHMWEKAWMYIKKAGTIILAASIIVWFGMNFPKPPQTEYEQINARIQNESVLYSKKNVLTEEENMKMQTEISILETEFSAFGRFGKTIEPVLKPIGFDWRIGVALITGFVAKEIVVSTLAVFYKLDSPSNEAEGLEEAIKSDPVFNPLVAYVLMLFTLIYVPCLAVLAVIRQELGSMKWVFFMVAYTISLAWIVSFVVYNVGRMFSLA